MVQASFPPELVDDKDLRQIVSLPTTFDLTVLPYPSSAKMMAEHKRDQKIASFRT